MSGVSFTTALVVWLNLLNAELVVSDEGGAGNAEIAGGVGRVRRRHQNDSCIKMGSDESHSDVSVIKSEGQSHKTVSTDHNF